MDGGRRHTDQAKEVEKVKTVMGCRMIEKAENRTEGNNGTASWTGAYSQKQRDRQQYGDRQTKSYREDGGQRE